MGRPPPLPVPAFLYNTPLRPALRALEGPLSSYATVAALFCLADLVLNCFIIRRVPYTEIDWKAYMQEVGPVMEDGEYNYTMLRGGTGPLVYPGGFVALYGALYRLTGGGVDIAMAQWVFVGFYLATFLAAAAVYSVAAPRAFHPLWLGLLCISKRVHSLYALRLFNDGPAMMMLWVGLALILRKKHALGCVFYSISVAIKMNGLLFAPALLAVLLQELGPRGAAGCIGLCAAVQFLAGLPFLLVDAQAYVMNAFIWTFFGRVFKRHWSVNFKWVPCEPLPPDEVSLLEDCRGIFTSKAFGLLLLAVHLTLIAFFITKWSRARASPPQQAALLLATNFAGVACARSLHFQFYLFYFHSLPFLLWTTPFPTAVRLALFAATEAAWNPWQGESSTVASSVLLTVVHIVLALGLLRSAAEPAAPQPPGKCD